MVTETSSASLPRPRIIGRSVRIVVGAVLLYFFANMIQEVMAQPGGFFAARPGWSVPGGDWWVVALGCLIALPTLMNSGYSSKWGEWVRGGYLVVAGVAILYDKVEYRSFWAAPLAWLVLLLILYLFGHAGVSFLVAGVAATPG